MAVSKLINMKNKAILLTLVLCLLYNGSEAKDVHNDSISIKFVRVEGGDFLMGSTIQCDTSRQDDELPVKNLKLDTYYISAYEITNEQWCKIMGGECSYEDKKLPKGNLSYIDCLKFIDSLNVRTGKTFRLPTEAQWEYAAKGGINDKKLFIFSGSNNIDEVAWYNDTIPHPVGTKRPNMLELYDMSGNVFEWCSDTYNSYKDSLNSRSSNLYVIRGGGYNREAKECRVSRRNGVYKTSKKPEYGFRVVFIDSKEEAKVVCIPLQSPQNKNATPKYIYWCILLALLGSSIVYLFLKKRGKTRMTIKPNDSGANQISDKFSGETNIGKKKIDILLPNTPAPPKPLNNELSYDKHDRFSIDCDNCLVVGASVRGKGHIQTELPCQDNNKYTYLTKGWGIAVVSDGAGSASKSQIGSKIVVERATTHFVDVVKEMKWIEHNVLPSNEDWAQIAYSVLRRVYNDIADFAQQKNIAIKDLGATVIVLIHSPFGILSTHIGDGRAGYRNCDGEWHSIIAPHKGEEANQTIFITSQFWDRPSFRMSGHLIPESVIIREKVSGFTLMSDGCENTSWQISQMDRNTGKVCDPNQPFQKFFDPLTNTLIQFHNDKIDANKRAEAWYTFLDTSKEFSKEVDDKTLILGIIL